MKDWKSWRGIFSLFISCNDQQHVHAWTQCKSMKAGRDAQLSSNGNRVHLSRLLHSTTELDALSSREQGANAENVCLDWKQSTIPCNERRTQRHTQCLVTDSAPKGHPITKLFTAKHVQNFPQSVTGHSSSTQVPLDKWQSKLKVNYHMLLKQWHYCSNATLVMGQMDRCPSIELTLAHRLIK